MKFALFSGILGLISSRNFSANEENPFYNKKFPLNPYFYVDKNKTANENPDDAGLVLNS